VFGASFLIVGKSIDVHFTHSAISHIAFVCPFCGADVFSMSQRMLLHISSDNQSIWRAMHAGWDCTSLMKRVIGVLSVKKQTAMNHGPVLIHWMGWKCYSYAF